MDKLSRGRAKSILYNLFIVLFVLFLNLWVVRLAVVNGVSMEDTLHHGDIVAVWQLGNAYRTGDIVVTGQNNELHTILIKRVIASEGQNVEIRDNQIFVDGVLLEEPYVRNGQGEESPLQLTVPQGSLFVMGDNRGASVDSREIGCISVSDVIGKAVARIYPLSQMKTM